MTLLEKDYQLFEWIKKNWEFGYRAKFCFRLRSRIWANRAKTTDQWGEGSYWDYRPGDYIQCYKELIAYESTLHISRFPDLEKGGV